MKTKPFLIITCFFLSFACGSDSKSKVQSELDPSEITSGVVLNDIESLNYIDYALSTEGEEAVLEWEKYQELAIQINYLKQGDVSFFKGERELLLTFITDLETSIPKDLETNPISSRVAVVITALLKLNDDLSLDNIEPSAKLASIKLLLVSFSNLNFQINKKLERDFFDSIQPE